MCIASSAHSQHAASRLGHLPADRQDDAMDGTAAANRPAHYNPNELLYVIFGICVVVYISSYLICSKDLTNRALPEDAADAPPPTDAPADGATPAPPPADDARRVKHAPPQPPPPPPTTPASHRITHILPAVLAAYAIDSAGCWPADVDNPAKHRLPPPPPPRAARGAEPKSAMVVYIAVALLLMSLAATLVDFCKAKSIRARSC